MLEEFIRYWWLPVLRGMVLIIFGLLALFLANNMSLTFTEVLFRVSLVMLFALYLGISGSLTMVTAALVRHVSHRWMYLAHGLVFAVLCLTILASPSVRLETVVLLTIIHAAVNGLGEAHIASALRNHRKEAVILSVTALSSLVAAVALTILREGPIGPMTTALGSYALFYGICLTYFGWHLHRQFKQTESKLLESKKAGLV